MIALTEHIEYLLSSHECVIVPGLGAFIVRYIPAQWDNSYTTLMPPSKYLAFNPSVSDNDGLLVSSLRRRHSLTYEKAVAVIADEVATMRHQLETDGEVSLGRLGVLKIGSESTLEFVPHRGGSLVDSRFEALPAVRISTVIDRSDSDNETDEGVSTASWRGFGSSATRRLIRIAASILLLLGIGFVASTPMLIDDTAVSKASVATVVSIPEPEKAAPTALSIAIPDSEVSTSVADTTARTRYRYALERRNRRQASGEAVAALPKVTLRSEVADRYCLVVASLSSMEEAEKYMSSRRGLNLLVQDGKYRVYAATGNSSSALRAAGRAAGIFARYPGAWVCARY